MALNLLYHPPSSSTGVAFNLVVVPGIGLPQPTDWANSSGEWLKELQSLHNGSAQIWLYEYEAVRGQSILQSLLQQSYILPKQLHQLNPRGTLSSYPDRLSKSWWVYMETGIVTGNLHAERTNSNDSKAYANMAEKRHENNIVLDHIFGVVFLGTPHIEDVSGLNCKVVESIVRASAAPYSFLSFTPDDNRSLCQISRGFSGFDGEVIVTFETVPSRYREKWKGPFQRTRLIIPRDLAYLPPNIRSKAFGISSNHQDLCKVQVGGELYRAIVQMIDSALVRYKESSAPQTLPDHADHRSDGSVLDGWDQQSLRSHRSKMARPIAEVLSKRPSEVETPQETEQTSALSQLSLDIKQGSKSPSATAGQSSQFSYEHVPSSKQIELEKPKPRIPCFSVGSQIRKARFFGRGDLLRTIDERLLPENTSSPVDMDDVPAATNLKTFALCGAGGIGKTELASEYIFSRRARYSAVFWVTADSRNVLLEDFARIAIDLGLVEKEEAQDLAEACELVKGWLCNPVKDLEKPLGDPENEVSWLLVLDNVDDWATIEDFWPTTGIGSILITSRDPLSRSHVYTAKHGIDLEPFSPSESLEFLNSVSPKHFNRTSASAKAVAEWAGGLPLIITAIASAMSTRNLTYNAMFDLLKRYGFDAVSADRNAQVEPKQSASISSLIGLACLDEHTKSLIYTISFFNPEGIPLKLLIDSSGKAQLSAFPKTHAELNTAQSKLEQASLISVNELNQTIRMHRIYQDIVRESLNPEMRVKALSTALEIISESWVYQPLEHRFDTARYEACSLIFPHVDRIFQHYEKTFRSRNIGASEQAAALFNDAGWYWFERGLPQESKPFFRLAQNMCETLQQTKPSQKVAGILRESHNNQGSAANETNDPQESLQHNLMWLSLMRERPSPDGKMLIDYELGCAYNEVGVSYALNSMNLLALEHFELSISTYQSLPNYDEKWLGWPLPNIGMVHWVQGNHEAALKALHRMRMIYETAYGFDDRQSFKTGKVLYGLGNVYLTRGDLDAALDYHSRCHSQWSETLGTGHHRIGDVCHKLAQVFMGLRQFDKAQEYLTRALGIFARRPYHSHERARTLYRQGQLHLARGNADLADQSFKAAHKQRQNLVPYDNRSWDELLEKDYDELIVYMSR